MTKYILLASAAAALAFVPSAASASNYTDVSLSFSNSVEASSEASYEFEIDPSITGNLSVSGTLSPDSAASAQTDAKQIMFYNVVTFDDPTQGTVGSNNEEDDTGAPGHANNSASASPITSNGNTGVNVAAGQYNMQQNSANLSVSGNANPKAVGGWANASTTGYQSLEHTLYGTPNGAEDSTGDVTNYYDVNSAAGGSVASNGNVGENVAAGAFNQQQNLLTIAVANNSILSETSAALWQASSCNSIGIQNESNTASSGAISGNGNIGVNVAAGVGNQQENALTAAVSNTPGGAAGGGGGGNP